MLIWMRESAFAGVFKIVFLGLLLMAVGGLVMMDVGGFFTGNVASGTVAKGGGVNIGATEFNRTVERVVSRQGVSTSDAYKFGLVDNILTSEIQNRLFTNEAKDLGLEVPDESIRGQIAKIAEPLATEGRTKKDALLQILRTQGIGETEFIGSLRQEIANNLLRSVFQAPATLISPAMAQNLYRYDNEKRGVQIIVFQNADIKDAVKPSADQLTKFYESNKVEYLIPETRTITMATLKTDMLRKNIVISEEQLKAEYEKNLASFTKPSRRIIEQVVLTSEDAAKKALEDMTAGKSVKNAMTQEYQQDGLLPEIGTVAFEAKKDAVLGPIKTDLGFHVLKIKDILSEEVPTLDSMKNKLKTELESIALTDELFRAGNTIEDRIAAGDSYDDVVREYGMTTEKIGPFRDNGNDSNGNDLFKSYASDKANLVQSAYDYQQDEVPPVVETADGQFHLIRIDNVIPDTYRPFDTVKAGLEKRWIDDQQRLATTEKAKKALEELQSGKTIKDISSETGAKIQNFDAITRKAPPPSPLTPVASAQIFSTETGKGFSTQLENGVIVGTVTSATLPSADVTPDEKELADLSDLTGTSMAQDLLAQYVTNLTNSQKIKVNKATLDQMYGDQTQSQ